MKKASLILMLLTIIIVQQTVWAKSPEGQVVIAISSLHGETFLPWNGAAARKIYIDTINEFLVYIDASTGKATPGLAERWEMSNNGKTWTFWIRKNIHFHEGWGELTAEDVKYSAERVIDPKSIVGPSSQMRGLIDKVIAPEKYKVIYNLKRPDIEFARGYMSNEMNQEIVCKKYIEQVGDDKANEHPIGTGPYTLAKHQKGFSIELTTVKDVENHWRITPQFKNIKILSVPEEPTRMAMLKSGEVDLAPISYDSVNTIKDIGLNVISIRNNWIPMIRFGGLVQTDPERYNPNNPWADKRVRQALCYAIDRDSIVRNIFNGEALAAWGSIYTPEWLEIPPYPYDPQKAKELLAQAGYPKGFQITMRTYTITPGAELPMLGQAVAMYWSSIGVDTKIIPTDWGSLRADWVAKKVKDIVFTHRGLPWTSIPVGLMVEITSKTPFSAYASKESEELLSKIENEFDPNKRSKLIKEMGLFLREEVPCVGLVYANEPYGASKKVVSWPAMGYATNIDLLNVE